MNFQILSDFQERLTHWRIPGNDLSVWLHGEEVYRRQAGFSDLEKQVPMAPDLLMYIYSCSKVATVTAGMQLLERGVFLLDDPVYDFLPEYREVCVREADGSVRPAKKPVTLRHLFTMTAGLTYDSGTPAFERARELTDGRMDTVTVARCLASDPLSFDPGAHWQYSLCHDVLAAVIEVASGKKFQDYMRANIFEPLGMNDTCYHLTQELLPRLCPLYQFMDGESGDLVERQSKGQPTVGGEPVRIPGENTLIFGSEYDSGGAGIITTVSDYAKLCCALANRGLGRNGERILSPAAVDLLRTDQLNEIQLKDFNWSQLAGYGYGLGVRTMTDRAQGGALSPVGEFGWGGAAGATVLVDPENDLAVFYAHHMLNQQEYYYQPRLRNAVYACLD